jgi:uncharacterized protein YidB (DUF937 family)
MGRPGNTAERTPPLREANLQGLASKVLHPSCCGAMILRDGGKLQEADMGLLDILNSIQGSLPPGGGTPTDPRAQPAPGSAAGGQGMSPMAKALLGLLAVYAMKHMQRAGSPQPGGSAGGPSGGLGGALGGNGGGLGDLLKGPLGGILGGTLGGAAAGTVLNGGLGDLLKQLQQGGQGEAANSWIGSGANKAISPSDLGSALGTNTLDQLSSQTGMSQDDILGELSRHLPRFVDQLTPNGRLPSNEEAARMI